MPKTLGEWKAKRVETTLNSAHKLIHKAYTDKRVTAATLTELAREMRAVASHLSELAASPFLAIDPTVSMKDAPKEPE